MTSHEDHLVVMESFREPRPTTNPYIVMLLASLRATPGVEVRVFSWARAIFGRVDVFHAQWPETLISANSRAGRLVRQGLMVLLLAKLWATRAPIVRTQHNLQRPTGISWFQNLLLAWVERLTVHSIVLNDATPVPPGQSSTLIRHGHYRDWFAAHAKPEAVEGQVGYFGLIRHYKRVDLLIAAFEGLAGPYRLLVAGNPSTPDLAESLTRAAAADPRVCLELRFLPDEELVRVVRTSELVVLPYPEMHNSGAVLAALSLDRPVLVPRNAVNDALAEEVGDDWVLRYDGDLGPQTLAEALGRARSPRPHIPDLSARDWSDCGLAHAEAFRAALRSRRHAG